MKNYTAYLSIPFKEGGRDYNGCDCYGLYLLIQKEQFWKSLKDFAYDCIGYKRQIDLIESNIDTQHRRVDTPIEGAGIVSDGGSHISTYIGEGLIIDIKRGGAPTISELNTIGDYVIYASNDI